MSKQKGRPCTSPLPREEVVAFRVNSVELKALNDYCFRYDMSSSDVIRDALMILSVIPDNPKALHKP